MRQIISELMEHDHEQLSEFLEELQLALTKHDAARAFELLDMFWARLAMHIRAENVCLFPAILRAVPAQYAAGLPTIDEVKSTIDKLRSDHNFFMDQLSQAVKTMREVTSGDEKPMPVVEAFAEILDRVNAVTSRLIAHNKLEEEQVYRWPDLMLGRLELESLRAALKHEIENMPARFEQS